MSDFDDRLYDMRQKLLRCGYSPADEPAEIENVPGEAAAKCEVIAGKDNYAILYTEAESNWKRVASAAALTQSIPCLVFTRHDKFRTIVSTKTDYLKPKSRSRFLVIDDSGGTALKKFMESIKVTDVDTAADIDRRVKKVFDELSTYNKAIYEFAKNLEIIITDTRKLVSARIAVTPKYERLANTMLKKCHEVVSEQMTVHDIEDMLIQHVITYRIFEMVYDDTGFHASNVVAKSLERIKKALKIPDDFVNYKNLELIAESITDLDGRQEFLKKIYETFYKKYDPEKARRDGIVYTPKEAVSFMARSTEILIEKHFNKSLSDDRVHILDPATGTGTFLVEMLRTIKTINPKKLERKYRNELHANELSVLPYYIAALNIEHAYTEMSGQTEEFPGICWTDTLDMKKGLDAYIGDGNAQRIKKQQNTPIFVVIGNPPYSVGENDVAEMYPQLYSSIQKEWRSGGDEKVNMDLYKVFMKWAASKIDKCGIVAFISNNSFIDAKGDFKLRESIYKEFDHIYIVNLKGNATLSGEDRRKQKDNVFGQQSKAGISISFFIKTSKGESNLSYCEIGDYMKRGEKLKWLEENDISTVTSRNITPTKPEYHLYPSAPRTDWNNLVPLLPKTEKESIFYKFVLGIQTNKDSWMFDIDKARLESKIKYYINTFNDGEQTKKIKLPVRKKFKRLSFSKSKIKPCLYRPFVKKLLYTDEIMVEWIRIMPELFEFPNTVISFPNNRPNAQFGTVITDIMVDAHLTVDTLGIPYLIDGDSSNITEWGIDLFKKYCEDDTITPTDVFYYTYAILNDPKYEKKYIYDLRKTFPRIPIAVDFKQYRDIGKKLAEIHIGFETVKPHQLKRIDENKAPKKVWLRIQDNKIQIDDTTELTDIPKEAMEYTIGPKTALSWVLEYYKEPKHFLKFGKGVKNADTDDEEVAKRFNTYRFADHKEEAIEAINRVVTVSVETMRLKKKLEKLKWGPQPKLNLTKIKIGKRGNATKTSKPDRKSTMAVIRNKRMRVHVNQKPLF